MASFYLRTESIKSEDILDFFVATQNDSNIVKLLKSHDPVVLEGSRGIGKSFLMKVAQLELDSAFDNLKCLPVEVSFTASSLVHTSDKQQFTHWMLAKIIRALLKKLRKEGLTISSYTSSLLSNDLYDDEQDMLAKLGEIVKLFEDSYKNPQKNIDISGIPDVGEIKEAIEEICLTNTNKLKNICFFFDEAAHVFRPEQQRQFFTLFRDLRSPYISCNAAIYPGVTHYGRSFEITHDCTFVRIERDILDKNYLTTMRNIVFRQADDNLKATIEKRANDFNTLAFSSGGNPRILFRTIQQCEKKFNAKSIESVIKTYYRDGIWAEHTELGEKYKGHKKLVDWGRTFIEKEVIPSTQEKNNIRRDHDKDESTLYFWIHKDAPETVKESLRLLCYTGIIRKIDDGIRGRNAQIGSRYEIKYGCILSLAANPIQHSPKLYPNLSIKIFSEFGANNEAFNDIKHFDIFEEQESDVLKTIREQMQININVLQTLTSWQKEKLRGCGIKTIEELHNRSEDELIQKIYGVGPAKARIMKNAAIAELLEYLSG
jgi:hypothetical protein